MDALLRRGSLYAKDVPNESPPTVSSIDASDVSYVTMIAPKYSQKNSLGIEIHLIVRG